ncbi:hypothetical protein Trydic_g7067 [Trypoxylus dichotomus]
MGQMLRHSSGATLPQWMWAWRDSFQQVKGRFKKAQKKTNYSHSNEQLHNPGMPRVIMSLLHVLRGTGLHPVEGPGLRDPCYPFEVQKLGYHAWILFAIHRLCIPGSVFEE